MRVLIYGINFAPELTGIGKYTGELATYLQQNGDSVEVITALPYYPQWKVPEEYRGGYRKETIEGVSVLRCPIYVPGERSGWKRLLHDLSFVLSSLRYWLPRYLRKYDLIVCISPPFHLGYMALPHRWLHGTRVLNHVQDLQVDAAESMGFFKSKWLLGLLKSAERFLLSRVSHVSTISEGMRRRIVAKGVAGERMLHVPNWVDTEIVHPVPQTMSLRREWGIPTDERVVMYSGNLGDKQGLEDMIVAADLLRNTPRLRFIIVGKGDYEEPLREMVRTRGLSNVTFKPLQPLSRLAAALSVADVQLVLQRRAAADLVLPSKLTNILAVGSHALVTAEPGTSLHDIVVEHRLGTVIEPENPRLLAAALLRILDGKHGADITGSRRYVDNFLEKNSVLSRFRQEVAACLTEH